MAFRSIFKHEWTHMLDFKLGEIVRERVKGTDDVAAIGATQATSLFSQMPERVQKMLPDAHEGLWRVAAAAQGLDGSAAILSIESQRMAKLEALSARAEAALMPNPAAILALSPAQRQELSDELKGPLKAILSHPDLARASASSAGPASFDYDKAMANHRGAFNDAVHEIAYVLETKLGTSWRENHNVPGFEPETMEIDKALRGSIKNIIGSQEADSIREISMMRGLKGMPLNPENQFAQASKSFDANNGNTGYMDAPEEMLARAIGRSESLPNRIESWANMRIAAGAPPAPGGHEFYANPELRKAMTPQMDAKAQKLASSGFSMMANSAGIETDGLKTRGVDVAERLLSTRVGEVSIKAASSSAVAINQSAEWCAGTAKKAIQGIDGALSSIEAKASRIGSWMHGLGALAAFGSYEAGARAAAAAKNGDKAEAAIAAAESGLGAAAATGSIASLSGVAKAAPLAKLAGPAGAAIGYVGAVDSAAKAIADSRDGKEEEASRHWKGAGIRAAGATGSLAAGMATGAAFGSAFPVVGTIAGAAVGIAVAYISDKWAASVESPEASNQQEPIAADRSLRAEAVPPMVESFASKLAKRQSSPSAPQAASIEATQEPATPSLAKNFAEKLAARRASPAIATASTLGSPH